MTIRTTWLVLAGGIGLAIRAAADASAHPAAVSVYTMSSGRIASSRAALVALIGAVGKLHRTLVHGSDEYNPVIGSRHDFVCPTHRSDTYSLPKDRRSAARS